MSGFGGFGRIVQSVDLIFMFLNWAMSLFVVIGALMVRGKRMLRDLLIALMLFAADSWSCCSLPAVRRSIFPWRGC